jgi:hypothetical protein
METDMKREFKSTSKRELILVLVLGGLVFFGIVTVFKTIYFDPTNKRFPRYNSDSTNKRFPIYNSDSFLPSQGPLGKDESSGSVQIHFPIEYRDQRWQIKITSEGKEIYKINDTQDDGLSKSNPISISLPPGSYEYVLERPPYFAETGRFVVKRGTTIIVNGENWTTSDLPEMGLDGEAFNLVPKDPNTSQ